MFRRKKLRGIIDDTGEAEIIRDQAREDMRQIESQKKSVDRVTRRLAIRRAQNHFGEDIQVTFRPRRGI